MVVVLLVVGRCGGCCSSPSSFVWTGTRVAIEGIQIIPAKVEARVFARGSGHAWPVPTGKISARGSV